MWQPEPGSVWQKLLTLNRDSLRDPAIPLLLPTKIVLMQKSASTEKYRNVCSSFNQNSQELGTTQKATNRIEDPKNGASSRGETLSSNGQEQPAAAHNHADTQRRHAGPREHTGAVLSALSFRTGRVAQGNKGKNSVNSLVWGLTEEGLREFWTSGMFYVWTWV